jgi:WD40 repeat protein
MKQKNIIRQIIALANISILLTACNGSSTKPINTSTPVIATTSPTQTSIPAMVTSSPTRDLTQEEWLSMQNPVPGLAWSTDGKTLAVSATSGVYTVDMQNNLIIHSLEKGEFLFPLVMDSQSKHLFAGNRVWDIPSGRLLYQLSQTDIFAATFSPDGKTLAVSSDSGITLYDALTGNLQKSLGNEFGDAQWGLAYSSNGNLLYASSSDHKVKQANLASGQFAQLFTLPEGSCCTTFSPDVKYMVVDLPNHGAGSIQLWDVGHGEFLKDSGNCDSDVSFSAISQDGKHFIIGCAFNAQLWDIPTQQLMHKFPFTTSLAVQPNLTFPISIEWRSAVFNQESTKIALGNNFGEILIWDVSNYQLVNAISIPLP